ncbi:MAG TPA: OmpA family protein [Casimicrobiaceae bacterium]|nr:OmpA family protein [Casimicrobiaceae bacterium]
MHNRLLLPAALALLLCACASRPPEPTAETTSPAVAPPSSAQSGAIDRGTANANAASGANVASNAAAPRGHEVFFPFDSSTLTPDAQGVVRQNATYVEPRKAHVRLEGNADERGSREYNLALGQRRAEAVRQAMVLNGVRADTLEAISNGEERPRCTEETESCFAENRRVDILVGQ